MNIVISKLNEIKSKMVEFRVPLDSSDERQFKHLADRTKFIIGHAFSPQHNIIGKIDAINVKIDNSNYGFSSRHIDEMNALIQIVIDEIELSEIKNKTIDSKNNSKPSITQKHNLNNSVFVVHGHNEEMKQSMARTLEKLKLNPIILHEQPNKGRTIIQKFLDYSHVGFAIILISADDYAYAKVKGSSDLKPRARQNVILELGFFLGKLGPERVAAIFEPVKNLEMPSDYDGVIFIPYDSDGKWKFDLVKELKAASYGVDANLVL